MDLYLDLLEIPTQDAAINLANHLLKEFRIPTRIVEVQDITSSLFVVLYESLFSDCLPGIIRLPASRDDEIHNCQTVIDVLSNDIIHDSLAHIRGEAIVAGDLTAIFNLLDVFSHLLEYVMKKIESDHDDSRSVNSLEATPETAQKSASAISSKKISPGRDAEVQLHRFSKGEKLATGSTNQRVASLNKNENRKAYDDHRIISHEDFYAMTYGGLSTHLTMEPLSPIRHNKSQSLLGQKTIDSGFGVDLEKIDMFDPLSNPPKMAWIADMGDIQNVDASSSAARDKQSPPEAAAAITGRAHYMFTHHLYHHFDPQPLSLSGISLPTAFSASLPPPSKVAPDERQELLHSTVGTYPSHTHPTQEEAGVESYRSPSGDNLATYYRDFKQLMKKTAALTRHALEASPVRTRAGVDEQSLPPSSEGVRLAEELNAGRMSPSSKPDQGSGGKKKVAFAGSQFETRADTRDVLTSRYCDKWVHDRIGEDVSQQPGVRQRSTIKDTDGSCASTAYQKPKSLTSKSQASLLTPDLSLNKQSEIAAAYVALKNEDLAIRKKQEMLHKFYEKDHEEFADDVEYMLGRHLEKAAETEEKYLQKCAEASVKKKGVVSKMKGTMKKSTWKKGKLKSTRYQTPKVDCKNSSTFALEHEEDLLPYLMEEFPYLYLTEHTWHELWRRGLHQIEALTRAYQEVERKKSRSQNQLAEAAERHKMLSDIMRKQLEHSQRVQEIKEQKQLQVQTRNKTHEKRIQSARARRYYNEYQVRARAKVLKKRTKEEMIFRELFKDTLNIQRERIRDIHKYVTDQRRHQEQLRQNEIDSLENYYHNQFEMLAERLARERLETEVRGAAQKQMLDRMKRELRQKMESEIKQYQEQMLRTDDDAHFRQADADRLKQYLHMALYPVHV